MSTFSSKFSQADSGHHMPVDTSETPLGEDERSEASRVAVWGSPHLPLDDTSSLRNENGLFAGYSAFYRREDDRSEPHFGESQLNVRNLQLMKQRVADGNVPLRADILDSDILIQTDRAAPKQGTVSVATVIPESESLVHDYTIRTGDLTTVINSSNLQGKEKECVQDTSMASVESIPGSASPDPMNLLSRRNLERFTAQLRLVGHTLTSEVLQTDALMRDFDRVPEDSAGSLKVEGATQGACESFLSIMKSQSDLAPDTLQKVGSCVDDASELTNPRSPTDPYIPLNQENLEDLKRQIASGCVPFRGDVLMGLHMAMRACESLDRVDVSQSMFVEANLGASRVGGSGEFGLDSYLDDRTNMDVNMVSGSCEGDDRGQETPPNGDENDEDVDDDENEDLLSLKRPVAKTTSIEQKEMSMRLNIQRNVEELRGCLQKQLGFAVEQARNFDEMLTRFHESLKMEIIDVRTGLQKMIERHHETLSNELGALRESFEVGMQTLSKVSTGNISDIGHQFGEQFIRLDSAMHHLSSQQKHLQHQVDKAFVLEALPPVESIPEGSKLRLIINIVNGESRDEVLLPISEKATVGMCKRELLRRIRQQGLVGDNARYSTVVLQQNGVTLYEDDLLEDVLDPESSQVDGRGNCIRLTLRMTTPSSSSSSSSSPSPTRGVVVNSSVAKVSCPKEVDAKSISDSAVSSLHCAAPQSVPTDAVPARPDDFGVLRVEQVDEISQNEALGRRLISETKRMEWSKMLEEEKLRRVVITKDALNRVRLTLLDRATYSSVEVHRRMARSALDKLDIALAPGSTVEEMGIASRIAAETMRSISSTSGEDNRVTAMLDAVRAERDRKERTLEEIKSLCDDITNRLRIPSSLLRRAESLTQDAQRAIILAPSMSQNELDTVHEELVNFHDAVRSGN